MVLLSLSVPKFNQWFGPILLRYSVHTRWYLSRGGILRDNPYFDAFCGIPVALKLIQLEVYHECKALETNAATSSTTSSSSSSSSIQLTSVRTVKEQANQLNQDLALSKQRLQVFEKYIRPALLPNNTWSDVRIWQFHHRILKWLRTEYLIAKYRPTIRQILLQSDQSHHKSALRKSPQLTKDFFGTQSQNDPILTKMMTSIGSVFGSDRTGKTGTNHQPPSTIHDYNTLFDPIKSLPQTATLTKIFSMMDWEMHQKNLKASRSQMEHVMKRIGGNVIEIRGGSIGIAHVEDRDPRTVDITQLSLEEMIEATGGHVMQCNAFNALCEDANIYQFWTREYIEMLGRYLLQRSARLQQQDTETSRKETIILDVGAGDGLLAQLLREFMNTEYSNINTTSRITQQQQRKPKTHVVLSSPSSKNGTQDTATNDDLTATATTTDGTRIRNNVIPTIIASDSGAWGISPIAPVVKQSVEEALDTYLPPIQNPQPPPQYHLIVLCSWMPMNTDWTSMFRQNHGVDEYILIGECDDGQCGDNWLTWGNPQHFEDDITTDIDEPDTMELTRTKQVQPTPQYILDGYVRHDLNEFSPYQFSRFDCRTSKTGRTVSFRKQ